MTPEQVTNVKLGVRAHRRRDRRASSLTNTPFDAGEGIRRRSPDRFGGIGLSASSSPVSWPQIEQRPTPAATTDLSAPGGKTVKVLMVIGFAAMAGTWLVGYVTPEKEPLGLTLSVILLVIGAVCLIGAGRIARKIRNASATGAAKK